MILLILIELVVLIIVSLSGLTLSFLIPLSFHENLASNELLLDSPLKMSIKLLLMTLLKFFGFAFLFC